MVKSVAGRARTTRVRWVARSAIVALVELMNRLWLWHSGGISHAHDHGDDGNDSELHVENEKGVLLRLKRRL